MLVSSVLHRSYDVFGKLIAHHLSTATASALVFISEKEWKRPYLGHLETYSDFLFEFDDLKSASMFIAKKTIFSFRRVSLLTYLNL